MKVKPHAVFRPQLELFDTKTTNTFLVWFATNNDRGKLNLQNYPINRHTMFKPLLEKYEIIGMANPQLPLLRKK